eukprot:m.94429 g.94429  ORF g.94429 m.94429 type:complete len:316 (+) comp10048_c0_seq1:327-1274(+)
MIVRQRPSVLTLMISMRGSIVPAIAPQILAAAAIGAVAAAIREEFKDTPTDHATFFSFQPFTALGVAISLFLGFRNNACYERWWEARKLWGKQLIEVRNLARLVQGSGCPEDVRRTVSRLGAAHSHALRAQLRRGMEDEALDDRNDMLTSDEYDRIKLLRNPADGILRLATAEVSRAYKAGTIDAYWSVAITEGINELGQVQGGCERIASTPLPFPYSLLVGRTAYLYIALAPFAMAAELGWWTIVFNAVLAYTFFGLDELAAQLEEPFATGELCLALSAMCRLIDISVAEVRASTVSVLTCPALHNVRVLCVNV